MDDVKHLNETIAGGSMAIASKPWWDSTIKAALIAAATAIFIFYMENLNRRLDGFDQELSAIGKEMHDMNTRLGRVEGILRIAVPDGKGTGL